MKRTLLAAAVVMVVWMVPAPAAAQTPSKAAAPAPAKAAAQAPSAGEAVYAKLKCSLCHSLDGKGQAKGPLDDVGSKLSADEIREWIVHPVEMTKKTNATRKPPMRAYPNLAKEDVDALVTYLAAKKKKG